MDTQLDKNDEKTSHFFSPAYFQLGPEMLWKKSNNLIVYFSTATAKLIIIHPHLSEFGPSFGVLQGDSFLFESGASISAYYKFIIMTNVSIKNRLNIYSNYLDNPQNIDVDYQMNVIMKINK